MKRKRKYYKLWLRVEAITTDQDGEDLDYQDLDEPISLGGYQNKRDLSKALDAIELTEFSIALLQAILVDGCKHDRQLYEHLKAMSRVPKGYKPTWQL